METVNETTWFPTSPKQTAYRQVLPDSPDYEERYHTNSDDLQPTSELHASSLSLDRPHKNKHRCSLVVVGSHNTIVTLGRGGSNTLKIGRRNRQISRTHVSIAFNQQTSRFELTVIGLNGACVDHVSYAQHQVAPLDDDSFVDVLGDQFYFKIPPPPLDFSSIKEIEPVTVVKKDIDIFRETSPEVEEQVIQEPVAVLEEEKVVQEQVQEHQVIETKEEEEEFPEVFAFGDALSSQEKESSPEPVKKEEKMPLSENKQTVEQDTTDYAEVIIDALVFSRTSSMPISDICSRILKSNPNYAQQPREIWIERIRSVLKEKPFFGEIQRKGKTADGSPTENLYYYNSELDPVEWRRATYTQVGRSARKCTLKDKQYFWKIPPKLGRHRSAYIPPPAEKRNRDEQHQDIENVDPKKTKF